MDIVYADERIVVAVKPAGVIATDTRGGMPERLRQALGTACVRTVHRLDAPVSGLMVCARSAYAAGELSRQIREGQFEKEYLAVVRGVTEESGTLVHILKKDGRTNTSAVVSEGTAGGKQARLSYERLAASDNNSLVRIHLDTGRHHQIRVQFAAIGHPLVGDAKYGGGSVTEKASDTGKAGRWNGTGGAQGGQPLALCSCRLEFVHPSTGKTMEFHMTPTGEGFLEWKEALG
ncbi:MAG: RluA family pseudouridine synthase [bacterium]|nr:RluA family pseudouridine synthase [bacterium]